MEKGQRKRGPILWGKSGDGEKNRGTLGVFLLPEKGGDLIYGTQLRVKQRGGKGQGRGSPDSIMSRGIEQGWRLLISGTNESRVFGICNFRLGREGIHGGRKTGREGIQLINQGGILRDLREGEK